MSGPTPQLLAMLFCDHILREHGSRKTSLFGIFDRFWVQNFPSTHPVVWVYARVTDAQGTYDFKLELVSLENLNVIAEALAPNAQVPDRNMAYEIIFRLVNFPLPAEGRYEFRLFANGEFIGNQSFQVAPIAPQGGAE